MSEDGYAKEVLVTTEWLAEHLSDDGLVVAEVDESPELYEEGHIPGAVKLHWRDDLQDPVERDVVDRETFEALLGSRGIGNDTSVILYGDKNNWFAAYAYWYLKLDGHEDVRILDGGRQKWIDEGRDITADLPTLDAYRQRLAAWKESFADLAAKRRASYVDLASDTHLNELIFAELRRRRVLG